MIGAEKYSGKKWVYPGYVTYTADRIRKLAEDLDESAVDDDIALTLSPFQFADEVFRIFASAHRDIVIRSINAGEAVEAMNRHTGKTAR